MNKKVVIISLAFSLILLLTCTKLKKEMLVTTGEATGITVSSSDVPGNIIDLGEGAVEHGHCYGTWPNLNIGNSRTSLGKPYKGGFTSQLTGLNPGTKYYYKAYITNGEETSYGAEKSFSTLAGSAPGAPVIGTATRGNGQAVISFSAPATDGGSAITGYTVTSNPGGLTGTGNSSPVTVTGLTNGTPYTFTVTATNNIGTSSPSSVSNQVIPATVPGAPVIGTATPGNTQATVAFTAPLSNGGSAITGYTVTSSPGGFTGTGPGSPVTLGGLTNGTTYTFTVTAVNSVGTSAASSASNQVIPVLITTFPGPPVIGTATAGNAQATITFSAPGNDGGSAITGYTVTSNPGGITGTGTGSPVTVTGLTNGTGYTFTVTATNINGTSAASSASNSVTPATVPGIPAIGTATAGNLQAVITFSPPASNGGSVITGYTVTSSPGGLTGTGTASPVTVTGLTNGSSYTFTVTASNSVGTGSASSASNSVFIAVTPGAPTIGTATAGNAQATVTFTAPTNNGGSVITGYRVTSSPGSLTATGSASPITVTGLSNGTAYTFTVTATNAIGNSPASGASNSVTPSAPPTAITSAATSIANTSATLNASVNSNGLSTNITFEYGLSTTYGSVIDAIPNNLNSITTTAVISDLTGLTENTLYHFRIKAVNSNGTTFGSDLTFTTTNIQPPAAQTISATSVTNNSATLNGLVNANDLSTTVTFEYGLSVSYGSTLIATPGTLNGNTTNGVSASITSLAQGTLYHFRVKAENSAGISYGSDDTFTTLQPPTVSTNSASSVAANSATLNGSVNPNNSSATVSFEYGTSTSYGSSITATPSPLSGSTLTNVSAPITGLVSNTSYHYRVKAINIYGTTFGNDRSFTTPLITSNPTLTKDTFVSSETPDLSYGTSSTLGIYSTGGIGIVYIYFNISSIPSGSVIQEATLKLYVTSINSIGDVYIARADRSWDESLTYNTSTRPGHISPNILSKPTIISQWWSIDVKSIMTECITNGSNFYGFYIWATSGSVMVNSKETSYKPSLTIKY